MQNIDDLNKPHGYIECCLVLTYDVGSTFGLDDDVYLSMSLFKEILWKSFKLSSKAGGCCGKPN